MEQELYDGRRRDAAAPGQAARRRVAGRFCAIGGLVAAAAVGIAACATPAAAAKPTAAPTTVKAMAAKVTAAPATVKATAAPTHVRATPAKPTAAPATAAPTTATTAPTLTEISAVSCASATHCLAGAAYAKGSALIATTNGGATWRVEYTTTRFDAIVGIDCSSAAHCLAIGDVDEGASAAFLETTDGGAVWTTRAAPASLALAGALSCVNDSDCWAVGLAKDRFEAAVARTTDGGRVWTAESIPAITTAMSSPFGISCASAADCVVTGEASLTTTNGGKTWARHGTPGGVPLGPVTCPSTSDCYAIFNVTSAVPTNEETFLYTSANGGVTWKDVLSAPRHVISLDNVSCPATTICVAVGDGYTPRAGGYGTRYGLSELTSTSGGRWAQTTVTKPLALLAVSCPVNTRDCIAGGETSSGAVVLRSANDGVAWTSEPLPRA
jgi:photosystem II stability/assembly factor-like uncharacterized protein